MRKRTIKLTEAQVQQILAEDYPFNYFGNETTKTNHNSQVMVNAPYDSPDVDPDTTISGDVQNDLSGQSWWNKGYGMSGYCR